MNIKIQWILVIVAKTIINMKLYIYVWLDRDTYFGNMNCKMSCYLGKT